MTIESLVPADHLLRIDGDRRYSGGCAKRAPTVVYSDQTSVPATSIILFIKMRWTLVTRARRCWRLHHRVDGMMDKHSVFRSLAALALSLIFAGAAVAQSAPEKKPLVVNGRTDGAVVQINGRSYVEVETLARLMNAAVSFEAGRVILTVAAPDAGPKPVPASRALSREFARAGVSQLAAMWEWKGAIASAIRGGVAGGNWLGPWLHDRRVRAESSLSQASLAARTPGDQRALELLKNEFASLGEWDSTTQASILSLDAEPRINPDAAVDDPLLTKISECGTFLNAMLVTGEFADSPSCH